MPIAPVLTGAMPVDDAHALHAVHVYMKGGPDAAKLDELILSAGKRGLTQLDLSDMRTELNGSALPVRILAQGTVIKCTDRWMAIAISRLRRYGLVKTKTELDMKIQQAALEQQAAVRNFDKPVKESIAEIEEDTRFFKMRSMDAVSAGVGKRSSRFAADVPRRRSPLFRFRRRPPPPPATPSRSPAPCPSPP